MKLSAYVSDQLWERVQARFPGARPSQVAQVALRRLVERSRPRFAAAPGVAAEDDLARRRARVSEVRQRAYDEGYEAGLAYAAGLRWSDLERLAAADWEIVDAADGGDPRRGSVAHRAGMRDALREVWLAVLQATAAS
ncbi:MAG: hypothetical protein E6J41_03725 [Chloroflexi bacterium]|nr:MAG: hypothetical protein E6J41_03725 [Chloroflexota bacterium]